jgi:hypothetical protein
VIGSAILRGALSLSACFLGAFFFIFISLALNYR